MDSLPESHAFHVILAITDFFFPQGTESLWDTMAKNYEKKKNIQLIYQRQRFRNFVDAFPPLTMTSLLWYFISSRLIHFY